MSPHSREQETGSTSSAVRSFLRSIFFPFRSDGNAAGCGAARRAGSGYGTSGEKSGSVAARAAHVTGVDESFGAIGKTCRAVASGVCCADGNGTGALGAAIEQTPTQIVFTATVPGEGSTSFAIEEVARAAAEIDASPGSSVRLEKELLWQQEAKILSALLLPTSADGRKQLVVLTEEDLLIYSGGPGNWTLENTKLLPGPRQAQRAARGQLIIAAESSGRLGVLLPGRRCEADVADQSAVACANAAAEWPSGRLMALPSCGTQTWWLKSDDVDWTEPDRLLLRSAGTGRDVAAVGELGVAGPVISISAGESAGNATVVVRNLSSGTYEVYRVALACGE
jgi:hypothetical protein